MRYLILSDLHANLDALETVLGVAPPSDRFLILGDIVGYGAEPNAVVERVRALSPTVLIRGNHDKVASGVELPEAFNPTALHSAAWTYETLTTVNRNWLRDLPSGPALIDDTTEICHGTPDDEDEYLFSATEAMRLASAASRPVCFFGHTHVAVGYTVCADRAQVETVETRLDHETVTITIKPGRQYLINPGAVGQPRDGDPRAAFALFDTGKMSVQLWRVPYDVPRAQGRIRAAGLPDVLARRLALGR
jgi:diadenosine tetraphosphatase ApaH/serine/threonine PP2A family protein phosphatase